VNGEPARIRPYQPDDLDDLYRICVQTADNGQDATSVLGLKRGNSLRIESFDHEPDT
jgi:hypothetical protein